MECQIYDCPGTVEFPPGFALQTGCASFTPAGICDTCGRVHFEHGGPVFNRPGYARYKEDFKDLPAVIITETEAGDQFILALTITDEEFRRLYLDEEGNETPDVNNAALFSEPEEAEEKAREWGYLPERHKSP